jgi:hypothetical protein
VQVDDASLSPFPLDAAPSFTSESSTAFTIGAAGNFDVTATAVPPATFSESGTLPAGVTLSTAGALAGTPAAGSAGTYPITITGANGVLPNASQSFILTITVPLGNIAGTVSAASGGADLANICVYLYPVGTTSAASYATCSLSNGTYEITGAASGSYDVAFADPTGTYATQWYTGSTGGAPIQSGAVAVSVPSGAQTLSGINAAMAKV